MATCDCMRLRLREALPTLGSSGATLHESRATTRSSSAIRSSDDIPGAWSVGTQPRHRLPQAVEPTRWVVGHSVVDEPRCDQCGKESEVTAIVQFIVQA